MERGHADLLVAGPWTGRLDNSARTSGQSRGVRIDLAVAQCHIGIGVGVVHLDGNIALQRDRRRVNVDLHSELYFFEKSTDAVR